MKLRTEKHKTDFCIIGAGIAGICAALSATRHGAKVLLMTDRPVLGGNSSSECRVHICGADIQNHNLNMRETGILEELRLENIKKNPNESYSLWDAVLYDKVRNEANIKLLMNCSCMDAKMAGNRISTVIGYQTTTQVYHEVEAKIFADCSGDSILAPLTGAEYRIGREAKKEFNESIAPEKADKKTMGMTCYFMTRKYNTPQDFTPPVWAYTYKNCDELPYGHGGHTFWLQGYWWIELGGEHDSIHDTEELRDELLRITFGVWDHIKNHCLEKKKAKNWGVAWIQFFPSKRESRRYIGDHVLNQNDIESEGRFDDIAAYGGWTMDDHHPTGFNAVKIGAPPTIFHHAPSPYGIPYRSMYSKNIENLMFAGRNISGTHMAISSTRVQGTCSTIGQAVGTAASIAIKKSIFPRDVNNYIKILQQTLINDDCYLPWVKQEFSTLTLQSELKASQGDPEPLRDGINRTVGKHLHCWKCSPDDSVEYIFKNKAKVNKVTLILDSALDRNISMTHTYKRKEGYVIPDVMPEEFHIEGLKSSKWTQVARISGNYQRFVHLGIGKEYEGIRFVLDKTHGAKKTKVYAFYID